MSPTSPYRKTLKIFHLPFISCYLYFMKPGGGEEKHFHDGIELEYVLKGSSSTHKKGAFYFRKKHQVHEGINDSKTELVFFMYNSTGRNTREHSLFVNLAKILFYFFA